MSKYYNIEHLMNFWNCSFDQALMKIAREIQKDPEYYNAAYDPISAVKKKIILNKRYNIGKILEKECDDTTAYSRYVIPFVIIRNGSQKQMRFSVGFVKLFEKDFPDYVKLNMPDLYTIKLTFSGMKLRGFLKVSYSTKLSAYRQVGLNGFLNYYNLKIEDIIGYYYADEGLKQDLIDSNVFYLYLDKRVITK